MEKALNLFVGSVLLSNLYYLSPTVGLPNSSVIYFLFITSFIGFMLRFKLSNLKLIGTKLTISLISLSFILFMLNSLWNYDYHLNDLVRIACYTFYFCWTISIFKNNSSLLNNHFKRLLTILFFLIVTMSFFEYYFYEIFKLIIDDDFISYGNKRRLAVTFRDPNSFAFAIISFTYIFMRLEKSTAKILISLIVTILLLNLTGSRLGLLLFLFLFYPVLLKFFNKLNFLKILIMIAFLSPTYKERALIPGSLIRF